MHSVKDNNNIHVDNQFNTKLIQQHSYMQCHHTPKHQSYLQPYFLLHLHLVQFCYLGDMLSVDGDADAAVEARIRIGWNKFRQLVPMLTNNDVL